MNYQNPLKSRKYQRGLSTIGKLYRDLADAIVGPQEKGEGATATK